MKVMETTQSAVQSTNSDISARTSQGISSRRNSRLWGRGSNRGFLDQLAQVLIIALKAELKELTQIDRADRTPAQRSRIKEIKAQLKAIR